MSFVSYAQNFEDVMLWRALKHVANGYYIDIGAQDPLVDSVSMAFYEHGWRGLHVEPTTQYADKLRAARPDETVMQVAIGSIHGSLTFFEFKDTGLSTADPTIAQQHKEHGFECLETQVPIISLDALLDQSGDRPVHWLKLDVEGLEKSVLESWQLSAVRPCILVIESTLPLTQEPNHAMWEPLVFAKGYEFAYFDGLNRFYVSQEHIHLKSAFDRPPNIFDDFTLSGLASQPFYARAAANMQQTRIQAQQAESRASIAETHAQQALTIAKEALAHALDAKAQGTQAQIALHAALNSRSWRITAPLRWLGQQERQLREQGAFIRAKALIKKVSKPIFRQGVVFLNRHPKLRKRCVDAAIGLGLYPIMRRLYRALQHTRITAPAPAEEPQLLTRRALQIYTDLKTAIEKNKGSR